MRRWPYAEHTDMASAYPIIEIEATLDAVVRDYGGVVLKEKLPASPTFNNADYVFHFEKIVGELKCLNEDNIHSLGNELRTTTLIEEYYSAGKIRDCRINEKNWSEWPRELHTKIYEATTRSLKKRIHKADVQIRETKRELKLDGYHGLVILANDGVVSLPPSAFIHATLLALRRHFTQINYIIYVTANLFTAMRGTDMPALFWLGVDLERGPKMDTNFVDRLGRNFKRLVCRNTGIPTIEQELHDIEGFWKARHVKV
jgi:hypothetical protein